MAVNFVEVGTYRFRTISLCAYGIVAVWHVQENIRAGDEELTGHNTHDGSFLATQLLGPYHGGVPLKPHYGTVDKTHLKGEVRIQAQEIGVRSAPQGLSESKSGAPFIKMKKNNVVAGLIQFTTDLQRPVC